MEGVDHLVMRGGSGDGQRREGRGRGEGDGVLSFAHGPDRANGRCCADRPRPRRRPAEVVMVEGAGPDDATSPRERSGRDRNAKTAWNGRTARLSAGVRRRRSRKLARAASRGGRGVRSELAKWPFWRKRRRHCCQLALRPASDRGRQLITTTPRPLRDSNGCSSIDAQLVTRADDAGPPGCFVAGVLGNRGSTL